MIHPKGNEKKFRIAAKATPKKSVAKAGQQLDATIAAAPVVRAMYDGTDEEAVKESIVRGVMDNWKEKAGVRN